MELVVLLIVIIILGALAGGNSFGETVRTGCGLLVAIIAILVVAVLFLLIIGSLS